MPKPDLFCLTRNATGAAAPADTAAGSGALSGQAHQTGSRVVPAGRGARGASHAHRSAAGAKPPACPASPMRRRLLAGLAGGSAMAMLGLPAVAQEAAPATEAAPAAEPAADTVPAPDPDAPQPFSFDMLTDRMREAATRPHEAPAQIDGFLAALDYDDYQRIQFNTDHARWQGDDRQFRINTFSPGWLFKEPVDLFEVVDGQATPMHFSTRDFNYHEPLKTEIPENMELPGVAGFRLNAPLNRADMFDEVVSFLGASYFRALGRGNRYGLSARGLAVNTAQPAGEEFPRFKAFYLERPAPGATSATVYAELESESVTGAYRFVITPGEETVIDVTARLFLRKAVDQLGIAPLTSMFLFGDADKGDFDDYRTAVHDSEALVMQTRSGEIFYRTLKNPERLTSSYLWAENPVAYGLVQRTRDFSEYLDAQAHYEMRPSAMIEPLGDWGKGFVRLVEIPSDLEGNDNIVAFWVPDTKFEKGSSFEVSYRMKWGSAPGSEQTELAHVVRSRSGHGGVGGVKPAKDRRKFVVDFEGGLLSELPADAEVTPVVTTSKGEVAETALSRIDGTDTWRLVTEISAPDDDLVEVKARLEGYGRPLSESWLYQWVKE